MLPQIVVRQLLDVPQLHYLSHPRLSKSYALVTTSKEVSGRTHCSHCFIRQFFFLIEELLPDEVDLTAGVHHVELHAAPRRAGVDEHHGVGDPPVPVCVFKGIHLQRQQ